MKYLMLGAMLLSIPASIVWAWDGFDADTAELVEITPDAVPAAGDTVSVKSYDTDSTAVCVVENVQRNSRTIEVVARYPDGSLHTLVMEGR